MTRQVIVVVASLSAFILAPVAYEKVEGGLAQEQVSARAAPTLSGHELASQKPSAQITTLIALAEERATQVKSDSLATTVSASGAKPAALSEIHTGRTRVTTVGRTTGDVVRSAKQGASLCIVFDNQVEFEAFNGQQGNVFKGIEDFEETPPGSGIVTFEDPLCGGIPNGPFQNGIDQLNLCVQSNILGGAPNVPAPNVANALWFVESGSGFGETSDLVLANYFFHSLDVMFGDPVPPDQQDNHTGVGFDTVTLLGGNTVEISVYDKNNVERVSATSPVDTAGSNFWGVWCPQTIGRINIFDTGNGAEGGDNIQMWVEPGKTVCGDDNCEFGETCETCPEDCLPCPFCGDGEVNQPSEECDPPGFPSTCPNNEACLPDCTCGDFCGDELCSGDEDECNCPQDCPGVCPECVFFFDQAEFEAFNEGQGQLMKGFEDFEESILPPFGASTMDDPLCGGIPNLPDGFPFPNGLDEPNLCVQSNLDPASDAPSPRGADGLVAVSAGFLGVGSDVVLANFFVDSLDLMFSALAYTAVGFDTLSASGGLTAQFRVYGQDNVLLAMEVVPLDEAAINFTGVWCNLPIGRINLFDPANGAEGGDNIQMWSSLDCGDGVCAGETCQTCPQDCGPCPFCGDGEVNQPSEECDPPGFPSTCPNNEACLPGCTCGDICGDGLCSGDENECNCPQDCPGVCPCTLFTNQAEFEAFNEEVGNALKGVEDFEETPPGAGLVGFPEPLCGGIPNGPFPNGIDQLNLCVQANTLAGAPVVPSPHGGGIGLKFVEFGSGFDNSSDIVIAGYFADSFDVMFGPPVPPDQQDNHTGVGFDPVTLVGGNTVEIRVYDENNVEMVSATSPVDAAGSNFWGVWCPDTIGRINIFDPGGGAQGGDNIQMWVADGSPLCGECPTDMDNSGDTGAFDLSVLLGFWGPCAPGDSCACLDADDDGLLGAADLAVLLGAWGLCE